MKAKLVNADDSLVYCVGHRRGPSIHTYIATHGSTRRGRDQAHADDADEDGHCGHPRKCPRILNDWTKAQPHIDKNNRWRQFELAIEERFRTRCFPFRLFTTVIAGMSIASAWALYQHHVNGAEFDGFRAFVHDVAYDAMTNSWDNDHSTDTSGIAAFSSPEVTPSVCTSAYNNLPSSASEVAASHHAVSIATIRGWKGKPQQRCAECNSFTSFCCFACSTPESLVAIHPSEVKYCGHTKKYGCLVRHSRKPENVKRCVASASRSVAMKRRNRDK